jgi:hypothetical protein
VKIKLPRKRKKACIKKLGSSDYKLWVMANELLFEENRKYADKFPKKLINKSKRIYSYW